MRLFEVRRRSYISRSGEEPRYAVSVVAQGVIFDSGRCSMEWVSDHPSVATYQSIDDVIAIHGHGGSTHVVQVAEFSEKVHLLLTNQIQDECENVSCGLSKNGNYLWDQRAAFAELFKEKDLGAPLHQPITAFMVADAV